MNKPLIISDTNKQSLNIKKKLIKILKKKPLNFKNLVIVIGGDGFMLQTLKKNKMTKNLFYGINSGNYGFLMNKFTEKTVAKNILKARSVKISPLEMRVITKKKN